MKTLISALLRNLVWLVPSLMLAGPGLDALYLGFTGVVLFGGLAIACVIDPISFARKDGEDRRSETRLSALLLLIFMVSALDIGRLHAMPRVDEGPRAAATIALALAYALRTLTIGTNRYFSGVLVIQKERGHHVVDVGPYAWVRHPGNLSAMLIVLCMPLSAGSWLALPLGALAALVVLERTAREDRFLSEHLSGYPSYAARVRFRLVPGLF